MQSTNDDPKTTEAKLLEIHGAGLCHVCGKPRAEDGAAYCSYPHRRLPTGPRKGGMVAWEELNDAE